MSGNAASRRRRTDRPGLTASVPSPGVLQEVRAADQLVRIHAASRGWNLDWSRRLGPCPSDVAKGKPAVDCIADPQPEGRRPMRRGGTMDSVGARDQDVRKLNNGALWREACYV